MSETPTTINNPAKNLLKSRKPVLVFNVFETLRPSVIKIVKQTGYDMLMIETEHVLHDEYTLTNNASNEDYIKGKLRKRFQNASQVIVLVGESTKNLYKYVRWELEIAQNLNIPIIAVNLNGDRKQNSNTCPPIIRDTYVVHIPFKMRIIKYALDNFPSEYRKRTTNSSIGGRYYNDSVYSTLGLND